MRPIQSLTILNKIRKSKSDNSMKRGYEKVEIKDAHGEGDAQDKSNEITGDSEFDESDEISGIYVGFSF